jgi:transposase
MGTDAAMAEALVTAELWEAIEPLLPEESPKLKGGRPRVPDRMALVSVLFVPNRASGWGATGGCSSALRRG